MIFKDAKWIWNSNEFFENEYNEFVEKIDWNGEKTVLRISVRGDYTLFVNGKFVECNQYGDFPHYKVYDEIDITAFLEKGENRICFLVWYFGKSGMRYDTPEPGLIYEVLADEKIVASSDENTISRKSLAYLNGSDKKISVQLGYSFTYDENKEDLWLVKDEAGFEKSCIIGGKGEFYARPIKKLCLADRVNGKIEKTEKSYIVDLGREIVGLAFLNFETKTSQKINVAYGEILEDGHVKRELGGRDFSFDYIAKAGKNEYVNYMFRLACRYIEITCDEPIDISSVGIIPQYYPAKEKQLPALSSDDKDIYEICLNTLKLCMMEHYVDCPWREQCLYAYDSRNQMLAGYFAFEDKNAEYARANLLLMGKDVREDDLLAICFPSNESLTIPSFTLYYILAVKEYIEYTGDVSLGEAVVEKIESILAKFINNRDDKLVTKTAGNVYWNFYDWSEYCVSDFGGNDNSPDLIINCITLLALDSYKYICEKIERKNQFCGVDEQIKEKARSRFYNKETGVYFIKTPDEKPTELVNSLAVLTSVATDEEAAEICEKLVNGEMVPCSLSMKVFKYDAMLKINRKKYKNAILSEIRKTYKIMVDANTGTVWETIDGAKAFDNAGSLCHGWTAIPIYYFDLLKD